VNALNDLLKPILLNFRARVLLSTKFTREKNNFPFKISFCHATHERELPRQVSLIKMDEKVGHEKVRSQKIEEYCAGDGFVEIPGFHSRFSSKKFSGAQSGDLILTKFGFLFP
jgi:hypothetical protein